MLLRIPILGQLVELSVPDPYARRLFAYSLEYGAMLARSGRTLRNPGGVVSAIRNRWSLGGDLKRDMDQLGRWLSYSHALGYLSIGQIGTLLMHGTAVVEMDGGQCVLDAGATPRQLDISRDAVSMLVRHVGEHERCEKCSLVLDGRWAELAPAGGPLNAILRDALECLIEAEAFPRVRPKDLQDVHIQDMRVYESLFDLPVGMTAKGVA